MRADPELLIEERQLGDRVEQVTADDETVDLIGVSTEEAILFQRSSRPRRSCKRM
jgi:hypothetical protein